MPIDPTEDAVLEGHLISRGNETAVLNLYHFEPKNGANSSTQVWSVETGELLFEATDASTLAVSPDGSHVVVEEAGVVKLYSLSDGGGLVSEFPDSSDSNGPAALSWDVEWLAVQESDDIKIFDATSGKMIRSIPDVARVAKLVFSRDRQQLLARISRLISLLVGLDGGAKTTLGFIKFRLNFLFLKKA